MLTPLAQMLTFSSFSKDWLAFKREATDLKRVQKKNLQKILSTHPYLKSEKEFRDSPVLDYRGMSKALAASSMSVVRYQPTSGSGDKEKLIPYTQDFINELNRALNPWLFDMYSKHPEILTGKHYWSLSWLPTHWRQKNWRLDDFELLPSWKKQLTRTLMAVPNEVSTAATLASSQFATLAYLLSTKDLTFFSVWSPTFLLQLLELIKAWEVPLAQTLMTGKWSLFSEELKYLNAPQNISQARKIASGHFQALWPKLSLISSWSSSTSSGWANKLQQLFPEANFQGKGLWATEGVISIPFENNYLLSYQSHYYEFLEIKTGNLLEASDLKEGMEVHPVLTCGNGFTRYHIKDRIAVSGFHKSIPALEFLERDNTFDMVGEKLDAGCFLEIHNTMKERFPEISWVIAFAVNHGSEKSYYHFVFEGEKNSPEVLPYLQKVLSERFHYQLAREIGQLGPEKITILSDSFAKYQGFQLDRGMALGNIKVELATFIKNKHEEKYYHDHFLN